MFRFGSNAYGRLLKKRYPSDREMCRHRLWGVTLHGFFVGVITMHKNGTPPEGEAK